ncbi:MAG: GGDEF domain-containing protein [Clostridia bacterium]|nr:GGDEF domain-containing protein [Clostridia bacterium]MBP3648442.1 GGDEF domain-containing protein [Clostridia bacterium]
MSEKKTNAVNEALCLPMADQCDRDLTALLRQEGKATLVMIDLDNFMQVNDNYGHAEGDRVLIATGEYLKAALPKDAALYRYGGDQFAVVFSAGYEKEDVFLVMERIRAGYDCPLPNGKQTLSVGIASSPEDGELPGEIVRKADAAMVRAKLNGHNRVCLAREEKMVVKTAHYPQDMLHRLTKLSKREGASEAILLREALEQLLRKYDA